MQKQIEQLRAKNPGKSLLETILQFQSKDTENKRLVTAISKLQSLFKDLKEKSKTTIKPVELLHSIIQQTNWIIEDSMKFH